VHAVDFGGDVTGRARPPGETASEPGLRSRVRRRDVGGQSHAAGPHPPLSPPRQAVKPSGVPRHTTADGAPPSQTRKNEHPHAGQLRGRQPPGCAVVRTAPDPGPSLRVLGADDRGRARRELPGPGLRDVLGDAEDSARVRSPRTPRAVGDHARYRPTSLPPGCSRSSSDRTEPRSTTRTPAPHQHQSQLLITNHLPPHTPQPPTRRPPGEPGR